MTLSRTAAPLAPSARPRKEFENFRAAELFCPRCKAAMPVREVLLLILPDGELFEYRCTRCGESLGKRTVQADAEPQIVF